MKTIYGHFTVCRLGKQCRGGPVSLLDFFATLRAKKTQGLAALCSEAQ